MDATAAAACTAAWDWDWEKAVRWGEWGEETEAAMAAEGGGVVSGGREDGVGAAVPPPDTSASPFTFRVSAVFKRPASMSCKKKWTLRRKLGLYG